MTNLEDVKFENENTKIRENAFGCCYNLKSVILPKNLKVLPTNLFFNCVNLENVEFGDIEKIDMSAFFNTLKFTKLILPKSLKKLDENFVHVSPCLLTDDYNNTADSYKMEVFSHAKDSVNEVVKK